MIFWRCFESSTLTCIHLAESRLIHLKELWAYSRSASLAIFSLLFITFWSKFPHQLYSSYIILRQRAALHDYYILLGGAGRHTSQGILVFFLRSWYYKPVASLSTMQQQPHSITRIRVSIFLYQKPKECNSPSILFVSKYLLILFDEALIMLLELHPWIPLLPAFYPPSFIFTHRFYPALIQHNNFQTFEIYCEFSLTTCQIQ